jgi:3'(2'), 5'-bisphosphate nucleotidase
MGSYAMLDSPEAQFAVEAVREAALLVRRIQREMVGEGLSKEDRSPVTVADFAAQALIARRLAERLPGAVLIGEEQADALRLEEGLATLDQVTQFVRTAIPDATPEEVCGLIDRGSHPEGTRPPATFWTLDPVDGTKGFLRREQYAVALAFICDGIVELGVLGCPELSVDVLLKGHQPPPEGGGCLVAALHGDGTWTQRLTDDGEWRQLHVSPRRDPASARLLRSVEKAHTNVDEIGQLVSQVGITAHPVAMDSQAKYAVLAAGAGDVLVRLLSPSRPDYREKIWDQAAGSIVVTEAGGRVSDLDGKPLDFSRGRTLAANRGVLATNGQLHDALLEGLRAIDA